MIQIEIPYLVREDLMAESEAQTNFFRNNPGTYGHNKLMGDFKGRIAEWAVQQASNHSMLRNTWNRRDGDLIEYPGIPYGHHEVKECATYFRNKRGGFPVARQHADDYIHNNRGVIFFTEAVLPYPYDIEGDHSVIIYGWAKPAEVREAPYKYDNVQHEQALRYNKEPKDKWDHVVSMDLIREMNDVNSWYDLYDVMDRDRENRFGIAPHSTELQMSLERWHDLRHGGSQ